MVFKCLSGRKPPPAPGATSSIIAPSQQYQETSACARGHPRARSAMAAWCRNLRLRPGPPSDPGFAAVALSKPPPAPGATVPVVLGPSISTETSACARGHRAGNAAPQQARRNLRLRPGPPCRWRRSRRFPTKPPPAPGATPCRGDNMYHRGLPWRRRITTA